MHHDESDPWCGTGSPMSIMRAISYKLLASTYSMMRTRSMLQTAFSYLYSWPVEPLARTLGLDTAIETGYSRVRSAAEWIDYKRAPDPYHLQVGPASADFHLDNRIEYNRVSTLVGERDVAFGHGRGEAVTVERDIGCSTTLGPTPRFVRVARRGLRADVHPVALEDVATEQELVAHVTPVFDARRDRVLEAADADHDVDEGPTRRRIRGAGLDLREIADRTRTDGRGESGVDARPGGARVGLREDRLRPRRSSDDYLLREPDVDGVRGFRRRGVGSRRRLGVVQRPRSSTVTSSTWPPARSMARPAMYGAVTDLGRTKEAAEAGRGVHLEDDPPVVTLD